MSGTADPITDAGILATINLIQVLVALVPVVLVGVLVYIDFVVDKRAWHNKDRFARWITPALVVLLVIMIGISYYLLSNHFHYPGVI